MARKKVLSKKKSSLSNKPFWIVVILSLLILICLAFFIYPKLQEKRLLHTLETKELEESDSTYVKAFGPWRKVELPDFTMSFPHDFEMDDFYTAFEVNEPEIVETYETNVGMEIELHAKGFTVSKFYKSVLENMNSSFNLGEDAPRNDLYLVGWLSVYKIVGGLKSNTISEYISHYNENIFNLEKCNVVMSGWKLEEGYIDEININNPSISVVKFVPDLCSPPEGCPGNGEFYLVETNSGLYRFYGMHEPFPDAVLNHILSSIRPI